MKSEEGRLKNAVHRELKAALCICELPREARGRNAVDGQKDEEVLRACFWGVAVKLGLGLESVSRPFKPQNSHCWLPGVCKQETKIY